ncbi:hypothetical protein FKM82_031353 [Ascaphus truei]
MGKRGLVPQYLKYNWGGLHLILDLQEQKIMMMEIEIFQFYSHKEFLFIYFHRLLWLYYICSRPQIHYIHFTYTLPFLDLTN